MPKLKELNLYGQLEASEAAVLAVYAARPGLMDSEGREGESVLNE